MYTFPCIVVRDDHDGDGDGAFTHENPNTYFHITKQTHSTCLDMMMMIIMSSVCPMLEQRLDGVM